MKKLVILSLLFVSWLSVFSQENSIFINDYLTPSITNPACIGVEYYPVVVLSARKQWLGFSKSPSTYLLAGSFRIGNYDFYNPKGFLNKGPLKIKERIGLGIAVFHDNNGPLINNGGILSYAYHLPVNRKSRLSFGMSFIMINHKISTSKLEPHNANDPYLFAEDNGGFKTNFGLGLYYYNSTYFAGLSANKLLRDISNINESKQNVISYYFLGGYKFFKDNTNFNFEPSFSLKFIDEEFILDIHSKLYIKRVNWIALSYSTIQQINIQFAINLYKNIYAGYNYGYPIGEISGYNYGTHEILIGINIGLVGVEGIRRLVNAE